MSFVKPIKYGTLTSDSSKTFVYTPEQNDQIVAPFDGVITDTNLNKCGGFIQLSHLIGGKLIYSEICGVNKNILVGSGMEVKKGEVIGQCGGKDVTFEVKDSNKDKITIAQFFSTKSEVEKNKKEDETKKSDDSKKKEEKKKQEKNQEDNLNEPKDKKGWDWKNPRNPKELPNLFTSLMLTPFTMIEKGLTSKKKENKEEDEKLNEELKRIKKLL